MEDTAIPSIADELEDGLEPEQIAAVKSLAMLPEFWEQKNGSATLDLPLVHQDSAIVNINLNTPYHFEVAIAIAHWFKTGNMPYHSALPQHIQKLLDAASNGKTQVYLNKVHVAGQKDRMKILQTNMADDNVNLGEHHTPDLTVIISGYSKLEFYDKAAKSNWFNNEKLLLLIHDFRHDFSPEQVRAFGESHQTVLHGYGMSAKEFLNFRNWKNAMGVSPQAHQWVLPTFVPFPPKPDVQRTPTTLCVQGGASRRDWNSLHAALQMLPPTCKNAYSIRVAGTGQLPHFMYESYKNVTHLTHLDDIGFGEFFQDCDQLLFLVSREAKKLPYLDPEAAKLTSSVTRALGTNLPVIALSDFKTVYPMLSGEFYEDNTQFSKAIEKVAKCGLKSD